MVAANPLMPESVGQLLRSPLEVSDYRSGLSLREVVPFHPAFRSCLVRDAHFRDIPSNAAEASTESGQPTTQHTIVQSD